MSMRDSDNSMGRSFQSRHPASDDSYVPPNSKKTQFDDDDEKTPILEIDGEYYQHKVNVDKGIFMARMCEAGGMTEDMGEQLFDLIRAKEVQ